jgi:hypothetical protein
MNTTTTSESRPFEQIIESGNWYPVMSVQDGDHRAYSEVWVSEFAEGPSDEAVDHSEASCYRVGLKEVDRWEHIDGSLAGYTGKTANFGTTIEVFMTDDDEGFLYIRKH